MAVHLSAAAKVNLSLRVLGRDADGYHRLRSLLVFADFADELWVEENEQSDSILWEAADCFRGEAVSDNILLRVLRSARACISLPYFRIRLLKRIPMGGGLGGGSADAAALLGHLVSHYGLSSGEAYGIADDLGSDIRVCLGGRACWLGGRGEEVVVLRRFPKVYGLLVWGLGGLSTADVFGGGIDYSEDLADRPLSFDSFGGLIGFLGEFGGNDLWDSAVGLCGDLLKVREVLEGLSGVGYVGMSGSGSVMFGLFGDEALCCDGYERVCGLGYGAVVCKLR